MYMSMFFNTCICHVCQPLLYYSIAIGYTLYTARAYMSGDSDSPEARPGLPGPSRSHCLARARRAGGPSLRLGSLRA